MLPVYEPWIGREELARVARCVRSGWISSIGEGLAEFEQRFASICRRRFGVSCSNGTSALHLALAAFDIGPGDEVLVPALSFVATANAVRYTGAAPVFVDVDRRSWTIDVARIEAKITARTRAIVAVHLYGQPADMTAIAEIARRRGLRVVEDAAEAHGASVRGVPVGGLGDAGCFSFYGNKMITTGEGGIVVTDDRRLAKRLRLLRDHAMSPSRRYWHGEIGFNYRMTNLQAQVGLAQLDRLPRILARKRRIAAWYRQALAGVPVELPPTVPGTENIHWMFSVVLPPSRRTPRDRVARELWRRGFDSRPFFVPLPELPPYRTAEPFPVASLLSRRGLNLPSGPLLRRRQIRAVRDALVEILA